jgi:hypothetical protein
LNLILTLLMMAPQAFAAGDSTGGSRNSKKAPTIQLGMSRAEVVKAVEAMGGGKLESDSGGGCTTSDSLHFTSNHVYAKGRLRFDRRIGEKCDIPVRIDKAYDIDLDFVAGLDGKVILRQLLEAFGKPDKQDGGSGSSVSYEWRKKAFSVLLVLDPRDGTAIRREIRDLEVDREIAGLEKRGKKEDKTNARKVVPGGL